MDKFTKSIRTRLDGHRSLRDSILEHDDTVTCEVEVPEWGVTVVVSSISAREREEWETMLAELYESTNGDGQPNIVGLRCKFLVKCLVDENGDRIFSDDQSDQLSAKNSKAIDRLWEVAERINTVFGVERMEKNSDAGP